MTTHELQECWIIGYGNRQRRDDGVGPYIVDRLTGAFRDRNEVHLMALPQLRTDLIEDLREADRLVFVDATIEDPEGGWKWCKLHPEIRSLPYLTHHVDPAFLLGLMENIYNRTVCAWLVSIRGRDFGFGEGLSPEAARAADRVCLEILEFVFMPRFLCWARETKTDRYPETAGDGSVSDRITRHASESI